MADATTAYPVNILPNTGAGNGNLDWSQLLPIIANSGLDIYSLIKGTDKSAASDAANIANPLLPLQPQARTDMASFMRDPSSVLKDPAFLSAENLGAENVARYFGSQDMKTSGNLAAGLFKYGQTAGLNYEDQRYRQLLGLLQPSPAAAAFNFGGAAGQQNKLADLLKQLFGGVGVPGGLGALLNLIGGKGGGSMGTWPTGPDLSSNIGAGSLDTGGTLGDLASGDFGGSTLDPGWFTGGSGDMFQFLDTIGG